jgi:ABC-type transport system, involved in lipoprotein release, permease component
VLVSLRDRFRDQALEFVPWYRLADFYNKTAELFSRQVAVLRIIIAVIIVLSISNSMMMSVLERTAEIGTALALGTRRGGILRQFLTEGASLGVFGGLLGRGGRLCTRASGIRDRYPDAGATRHGVRLHGRNHGDRADGSPGGSARDRYDDRGKHLPGLGRFAHEHRRRHSTQPLKCSSSLCATSFAIGSARR